MRESPDFGCGEVLGHKKFWGGCWSVREVLQGSGAKGKAAGERCCARAWLVPAAPAQWDRVFVRVLQSPRPSPAVRWAHLGQAGRAQRTHLLPAYSKGSFSKLHQAHEQPQLKAFLRNHLPVGFHWHLFPQSWHFPHGDGAQEAEERNLLLTRGELEIFPHKAAHGNSGKGVCWRQLPHPSLLRGCSSH